MTYILTIAYNTTEILSKAYKQLVTTCTGDYKVILLNNHYPVGNKAGNDYAIEVTAKSYNFQYEDLGKNVGSTEGYNYLISLLPKEVDKFILYDGDSYPLTTGWNEALIDVLESEHIIWTSLQNDHSYKELEHRGGFKYKYKDYNLTCTSSAVVNSVSAFKRSWIDSVGGIKQTSEYYGGFEIAMWNEKPEDKKWVFLDDYKEGHIGLPKDEIYTAYKWAHAHEGDKRSFEEFIKQKENE